MSLIVGVLLATLTCPHPVKTLGQAIKQEGIILEQAQAALHIKVVAGKVEVQELKMSGEGFSLTVFGRENNECNGIKVDKTQFEYFRAALLGVLANGCFDSMHLFTEMRLLPPQNAAELTVQVKEMLKKSCSAGPLLKRIDGL